MAVFKPNNFYPYQQESDMESLDGNIFSCQINTDGNLVSGAKLKILSAIDNTELYENIYQFEYENITEDNTEKIRTPYKNRDIAEMEVLPYQIYPEYKEENENGIINKTCILSDIKFQSLCDSDVSYEYKIHMCPYNFFLVKKNKLSLFKIKAKLIDINGVVTLEDIDFSNFQILASETQDNSFSIYFNDVSVFEKHYNELSSGVYSDIFYYIVLKNNYDYFWNVRLYEHYFNNSFDKGTLVTDGYITGSTKNVLWYNDTINGQIEGIKNYVKKDNYVEVVADDNNSDVFLDQIIDGKTMRGTIKQTEVSKNIEIQILKGTKERMFTDLVYDGIIPQLIYTDKYEITDSGQIVAKDVGEQIWYADTNYATPEKMTTFQLSPNFVVDTRFLKETDWMFLEDVLISVENNRFVFDFSKSSIGEYVYRAVLYEERGEEYNEQYSSREDFYNDLANRPFICRGCQTHVMIKKVFQETEDEIQNYANYTDSQIETLMINNESNRYFIKVLTPAPLHADFYNITQAPTYWLKEQYSISNIYKDIDNGDLYCFNHSGNTFNAVIYTNLLCAFGVKYLYGGYIYPTSVFDTLLGSTINPFTFNMMTSDTNMGTTFINMGTTFSQEIELKNNRVYTFNSKYHVGKIGDYGLPSCDIKIDIYSKSDSTYNKTISLISDANIEYETTNILSKNFEIPSSDPSDLYGIVSVYCYQRDYYKNENCYIYDLELIENGIDLDIKVYLQDDVVDFSKKIKNMYIEFNYNNNIVWDNFKYKYLYSNVQKIEKYDTYNKTFILCDKKYQNTLIDFLEDSSFSADLKSISYKVFYKQREKIVWITYSLGYNQNINKIETQNEFDVNLKNESSVYLYPSSDKNTYNSFFGEKDTNFNVDNLYIRFPDYEGKDATGNYIKNYSDYYNAKDLTQTISYYEKNVVGTSTTYVQKTYTGNVKGPFFNSQSYFSDGLGTKNEWTNELCPLALYGSKVHEDAFKNHIIKDVDGEISGYYNKLFKVSSYDVNTGEFIIAGGLEREILSSDRYEIWKKEAIEGSDNEYDITEVISTYTRIYPEPIKLDDEVYIGVSNTLIPEGLKILNSNNNFVFIQPNINFSSDVNVNPFLVLDDTEEKLVFPYSQIVDNIKYNIVDNTIEKLDNSQWLLKYNSSSNVDLIPGMTYKLYTDWADSTPSSYFYARNLGNLELKYGELSYVNSIKNSYDFSALSYDLLMNELSDFGENIVGMDIYLLAKVHNATAQIKKYRYKIYDEDMNLLWDSLDIWDNIVEYSVRGIVKGKIYYLVLECEDEYGYEYIYSETFCSNYIVEDISNEYISVSPICSKHGIKFEIQDKYFSNQYNLSEAEDIKVYKKDSSGNSYYVNTLNRVYDKITNNDNNVKYGFIDYNVRNNEYYDYMFVFDTNITKDEELSTETCKYIASTINIKTNFDSWMIVDIIRNNETGVYEVSGDVWMFKYNLESSDIVHNTSVYSWDTLGRYGQLGYGEKGYDSSGLTCLLGDVSYYLSNDETENKKYGYHENISTSSMDMELEYNNGKANNIEKHKKWKNFCRSNNYKLLKDITGNIWIVGIMENPTTRVHIQTKEQLKVISFQWQEIMNSENISIIGKIFPN